MAALTSAMTHSRGAHDEGFDVGVRGPRPLWEPVLLLGAHDHPRLATGHERTPFAQRGRAGAEVGDQPRIHGVRLDPGGISHADRESRIR